MSLQGPLQSLTFCDFWGPFQSKTSYDSITTWAVDTRASSSVITEQLSAKVFGMEETVAHLQNHL